MEKPKIGSMGWMDITVPDATSLKDFYAGVVGWEVKAINMGDYDDYAMKGGDSAVGICHARGPNTGIPPVWMPYFVVADLDASLAECEKRGGTRAGEIRSFGPEARYCCIRDPQGAYCVLFQA